MRSWIRGNKLCEYSFCHRYFWINCTLGMRKNYLLFPSCRHDEFNYLFFLLNVRKFWKKNNYHLTPPPPLSPKVVPLQIHFSSILRTEQKSLAFIRYLNWRKNGYFPHKCQFVFGQLRIQSYFPSLSPKIPVDRTHFFLIGRKKCQLENTGSHRVTTVKFTRAGNTRCSWPNTESS